VSEISKGGRPPIYEESDEMENDIKEYFKQASHPYTVAGLANHLDITTRTLNNYQKKEEFFPTIKKAKQKIMLDINQGALRGDYVASIAKFNLQNNFGWKDTKRQELTGADGGPIESKQEDTDWEEILEDMDEDEREKFVRKITQSRKTE